MENFRSTQIKRNETKDEERKKTSTELESPMYVLFFIIISCYLRSCGFVVRLRVQIRRKLILEQCALRSYRQLYFVFLRLAKDWYYHQRESSHTAFLQVEIPDHFIQLSKIVRLCSSSYGAIVV